MRSHHHDLISNVATTILEYFEQVCSFLKGLVQPPSSAATALTRKILELHLAISQVRLRILCLNDTHMLGQFHNYDRLYLLAISFAL